MSYNNEFTGSTEVYLSYANGRENSNKKPKAIKEVEKLIATLEAEGGEAAKPLIEKKQAEIYELEAKYDFAKLVLSKMDQDEDNVMNFQFTFHIDGQRYYAEGTFYNRYKPKPKTKTNIFGRGLSFDNSHFDNSPGHWLGIILESNEPQNGKVIKGGSIVFEKEREKEDDSFSVIRSFDSKSKDDPKNEYIIDAVLQTIDGEIVTICQTLYKI